jgi:hypothetical protein
LREWAAKTDTTDAEIALWARLYPTSTNTGILTLQTPAIDIDITDPEAAMLVEDLARDRFGERGYFLVRFGKAPKRDILLRTDRPFKKIAATLIARNGGTGQRIEFLCDGQQLAIHGIHPDTHENYRWHGGRPGDVAWRDLPCVSADDARAFLADAVALLIRGHGFHGAPRRDPVTRAPPTAWRDLVVAGVSEGSRNDGVARLAGHLLRRFVEPHVVLELLQSWNLTRCIPPLPPAEVERTVDSICGAELRRRGLRHDR